MSALVVTLHGFLGAPSLWGPAFAHPALAPLGTRATHLWLPGHGPEPWWLPGQGFEAVVDALAARLPEAAVLLGYSLGARVALGLVARHPGRFAGAVVVGAHPGLDDEGERRARAAWDDAQAQAIEAEGLDRFAERWQRLPIFATQSPAQVEAQAQARRAHRPEAAAWAMRALGLGRMPALGPSLERAGRPLLLVTGALDDKFTAIAARAAGRWPGARHQIIEGAGHNVPLEAPGPLAAAVRQGIDRILQGERP